MVHFHLYGNLLLSLLYLFIFAFIVKDMIIPSSIRSPFSICLGMLFLLLAALFLNQGLGTPPWEHAWLEVLWMILASVPGVFYTIMIMKNHSFLNFLEMAHRHNRFDKIKEEFLSVASHELRTPISVINGFAEILIREKLGPLNDEQKRRMRKILMQAQRLTNIIDELLDLSRIRRGKLECKKQVFDLVPVLKACLDDQLIVCEQQGIELKDDIPDVLPDVNGDLERVTQIVVNLINNAIKYTDRGGRVVLSAFHEPGSPEVNVQIIDTGLGIDQEDQEFVFQEFFRAKNQQSRKLSGSGLGLAIVKHLVEAQGGRVGVQSEGRGKGSTFFFTIPIAVNGRS